MVPDGMLRKSLGFFFAEDFTVFGVFWRDFCFVYFLGSSYRSFTEQYAFDRGGSWFIYHSRYESCFGCVCSFKHDWQLCVVDPASLPIDFGLYRREPGVAQDCFMFA